VDERRRASVKEFWEVRASASECKRVRASARQREDKRVRASSSKCERLRASSISLERLKLETSNFVCIDRARGRNGNMQTRSNGVKGRGHVTYF